jgi:alkanesulfonate monooxygenase SsuD/methylene tetrahydromethanopterin reductase-like flavin-dependent oxidoreductase (luciferase family)
MTMIIMRYDLRIPPTGSPAAGVSASGQYGAMLEQVRWADRTGLDMVVLSEHHGTDDGFMPAPITLAAGVAAATERIGINISAALVIMHDPVRLAEQLATVDLIAKGRLSVICGTGYRQEEFEMAGLEFAKRFGVLEETVRVLRDAWTGDYFEYQGRRVRVRPLPHTPGGPLLMMGGSTAVAARRAARLRCFFQAANDDPSVAEAYNDECQKVGFQGFVILPPKAPGFVHVTEDPERDWERLAPYVMHEARTYAEWQRPGQSSVVHVHNSDTLDDVRASGVYAIVTPEECIELARRFGSLTMHPLMGGISPDIAAESLDLFERRVLPVLRG